MLIEEMIVAHQEGTLGKGQSLEWLEIHHWQVGNAINDLSMRHDDWTDRDAERMDELIRMEEHVRTLINYLNYAPDSGRSSQQPSHRQPFGFSGFGTPKTIQYPDYGPSGYSGLD